MAFGDCISLCRSVYHLVHSGIIFRIVRNSFSRHHCTRSAFIKPSCSSHHLSGAHAVTLTILQCSALVGTRISRPLLGVLIMPNHSPAVLRVSYPLLLHMCLLLLVWVSTLAFCLLAIFLLHIAACKCPPQCRFPALLVWWLLMVFNVSESSPVIPHWNIVAPLTTNPLPCLSTSSNFVSRDDRDWVGISFGIVTWTCGFVIHL